MNLSGTWNLSIKSQRKQTGPLCNLRKDVNFICPQVLVEENSDLDRCYYERDLPSHRTCPLSCVEHTTYSASYSFHLCTSESLVSWFSLVASSSIFLSKNVNFLYGFRLDPANNISFPERTIPEADNTSQKILKYEEAESLYAIDSPLSFRGNSGSSYVCSSENPSTPLSTKCDSSSEVSDLDKASYWDSLFNLEGEDCEWISDFKPSSPLSTKCDSSTEVSDFDRASYLDSLLSLEEEDCEWISDSKPELEYFRFEALSSAEDLLETQDMEQVIADEPLFWPFEEEFNWNPEESWSSFAISPRKHINCFGTSDKSFGLILLEGKSEPPWPSMLSESSAKIAALEKRMDKDELKTRVVPRIKPVSVGKKSPKKNVASKKQVAEGRRYFALGQELPIETLVGLEEFDGQVGLDAESKGNFFMLE